MNITIVCKGGVNTGLGHLHRTISFIEGAGNYAGFKLIAIIDKGLEVLFKNMPGTTFIYEESGLPEALSGKEFETTCCIIDSTDLNPDNQRLLRNKYGKIISLSPVFNNYGIIDVLFTRFGEYDYPSHIKVFGGLEYTIFNSNCLQIPDNVYAQNLSEKALTVGISMGGVDAPNKTLSILRSLAKLEQEYTFWVLLGEGYSHSYQDIVDAISKDSNHEIVLAKSNRSMWKILSNCSLAVFAGGLTSFEAIYAGLPAINIFEKEIHRSIISREITEKNVSVNLGMLNDQTLEALKEQLTFLYSNRTRLSEMRMNAKGLVDKSGPERTIKKILELIGD
ncbi:MAG: hypothetical protein ACJ76F_12915 [Bacteroidia bacterium]